ncbi:YwpF family protein [Aciduricibacillus chroicocephali]|uniref:YwpF family protein n=1 Tax=Aciduricibacillus chroicocephali TaxID=3054939 RepID=A0ABY9KXP7_9BACI|nr:YwpF family protein [Bacillaceae bacterium 44XB]
MKTFYLKSLAILEEASNELNRVDIELIDGLIINREDENHGWIVEAYIDKDYNSYFINLKEQGKVMIEVKITSEHNEPATMIAEIIGMNELGKEINVLFRGKIVDERKERIEKKLKELIDQGYQGDQLLEKLKSSI